MSAFGPKQTCTSEVHMSASGGKPDMTGCGSPLSQSLSGVKQTWVSALHMSAFDPKRTLVTSFGVWSGPIRYPLFSVGSDDETTRIHYACGWYCSHVAGRCYCTAG